MSRILRIMRKLSLNNVQNIEDYEIKERDHTQIVFRTLGIGGLPEGVVFKSLNKLFLRFWRLSVGIDFVAFKEPFPKQETSAALSWLGHSLMVFLCHFGRIIGILYQEGSFMPFWDRVQVLLREVASYHFGISPQEGGTGKHERF